MRNLKTILIPAAAVLAVLAVAGVDGKIALKFSLPQIGSLIIFALLLFGLFRLCIKKKK